MKFNPSLATAILFLFANAAVAQNSIGLQVPAPSIPTCCALRYECDEGTEYVCCIGGLCGTPEGTNCSQPANCVPCSCSDEICSGGIGMGIYKLPKDWGVSICYKLSGSCTWEVSPMTGYGDSFAEAKAKACASIRLEARLQGKTVCATGCLKVI